MIAFCTRCWREIDSEIAQCPRCGADQSHDLRSYEEKIVAALAHPLPEARARICWLIGETHIRAATPNLIEIVENDPDIFVQRAAIEALGALQDPRSDAILCAISRSDNRFLANAARESLRK